MKLVLIPAGEFMMGSGESPKELARAFHRFEEPTPECFEDEFPQHKVRITKAFFLGASHVTIGQFRSFVNETHYRTDAEKDGKGGTGFSGREFQQDTKFNWRESGTGQADSHPVVNVSWNDATAFCSWLTRKEGITYRLPTEAEWEYACRAGTKARYLNGDDPEQLVKIGNTADAAYKAKFPYVTFAIRANDGYVFTSPVSHFSPNAFGLYDMHGNALQWCSDWYDAKYYSASPADDPPGPQSGALRVFRGGSWTSGPTACRSAKRGGWPPSASCNELGFRVARTLREDNGDKGRLKQTSEE